MAQQEGRLRSGGPALLLLEHLPAELLLHVASFLELRDLSTLTQVSSAWKDLASSNSLWRRLVENMVQPELAEAFAREHAEVAGQEPGWWRKRLLMEVLERRENYRSFCRRRISEMRRVWKEDTNRWPHGMRDLIRLQGKHSLKTVLAGESGVGKTTFVDRIIWKRWTPVIHPTLGGFCCCNITVGDGAVAKLEMWDTAGQERFNSLAPMFFRGAHVVLLMYDITNRTSFDRVSYWRDVTFYRQEESRVPFNPIIGVVGCKLDLVAERPDLREVSEQECQRLAFKLKAHVWAEISSKSEAGIASLMQSLARLVLPYDWAEEGGKEASALREKLLVPLLSRAELESLVREQAPEQPKDEAPQDYRLCLLQ